MNTYGEPTENERARVQMAAQRRRAAHSFMRAHVSCEGLFIDASEQFREFAKKSAPDADGRQ